MTAPFDAMEGLTGYESDSDQESNIVPSPPAIAPESGTEIGGSAQPSSNGLADLSSSDTANHRSDAADHIVAAGSGADSRPTIQAVASALRPAGLSSSSEDDETDDDDEGDANGTKRSHNSVALPTVDGLFESVGPPKFLEEDQDASELVRTREMGEAMLKRHRSSKGEGKASEHLTVGQRNEARALAEATSAAEAAAARRKRTVSQAEKSSAMSRQHHSQAGGSLAHPALFEAEKRALAKGAARTRQTESAKDRVKRQRLRGQTLGGETTVWKSETEMRLRQQFD